MIRKYPSALYKFTSAERIIKILDQMVIRFTQADFLNDPYECHLTIDRDALGEIQENYRRWLRDNSPKDAAQIENSLAMSEESLLDDALREYREARNDFGVLSLTEDPLNLLMWAHYGDEHKGVVIELDYMDPSLFFQKKGEFCVCLSVNYSLEKIRGVPSHDAIIETLTTKSLDWGYEKEWRIIRSINSLEKVANDVYVSSIPPSVIKRIILGARFPAEKLDEIVKHKDKLSHLKIEKAVLVPGKFELKLLDLEQYAGSLLYHDTVYEDVSEEARLFLSIQDE